MKPRRKPTTHSEAINVTDWLRANKARLQTDFRTGSDVIDAIREELQITLHHGSLKEIAQGAGVTVPFQQRRAPSEAREAITILTNALVGLYEKLGGPTPPDLVKLVGELNEE